MVHIKFMLCLYIEREYEGRGVITTVPLLMHVVRTSWLVIMAQK
jgi:hypothetical protein